MSISVLQSWVERIPLKAQSLLLLSLRGPDTHACPEIKIIVKWMRGLTFKPGDPDNIEFMGARPNRIVEKGPAAKELEFCSVHYYSHLMHGLEVLGQYYPRSYEGLASEDCLYAWGLYCDMCKLLHLDAEAFASFNRRLGMREWPGGTQPNNFEEALRQR